MQVQSGFAVEEGVRLSCSNHLGIIQVNSSEAQDLDVTVTASFALAR